MTSIDAREAAPAKATEDMFHGDPSLSSTGALSVAIPGEIKGYQKAKEMFGNPLVSWESLIQPSIELARKGIPVTFSKAQCDIDSNIVAFWNISLFFKNLNLYFDLFCKNCHARS